VRLYLLAFISRRSDDSCETTVDTLIVDDLENEEGGREGGREGEGGRYIVGSG